MLKKEKKRLFQESEEDQNCKQLQQKTTQQSKQNNTLNKNNNQINDEKQIFVKGNNTSIISNENIQSVQSFSDLQVESQIVDALKQLGYQKPTKIQSQSLKRSIIDPKMDLLCLSETGSGKTLSFLIPIINSLHKLIKQNNQYPSYALIIAPTRELCLQIQQYLIKLKSVGLDYCTSVVLHGGSDTKMKQVIQLAKKPSIIIGTPGRILDHLQNTKGFDLSQIKYLVLDEADKLLNLDFQKQIRQILEIVPKERTAYLYSATLTSKVEKLQRVSLNDPTRIQINLKYKTVEKLDDFYIFIPSKWKDCYLVYLLTRFKNDRVIIFGKTCLGVERLYLVLKHLKFSVDCLHGDLSQAQRIKGLQNFKNQTCRILVCTDVAARGIDINDVNLVINYDLCCPKDYVHRVGRTARIGNQGKAISIVTQYDVQNFQQIQKKLNKTIPELQTQQTEALVFLELLDRCHQEVSRKMKQSKNHKV